MRFAPFWIALWVAMIVMVIIGSIMPARDVPVDMGNNLDKLVHFLGYFVLSAYATVIFRDPRKLRNAIGFLVALGGAIEIAQGLLTETRSADILDFLVNSLGVLAAYGLQAKRPGNPRPS